MNKNEICDYIERAPKKWAFNGGQMVNTTHARLKWLCDLSRGTIHEKINRRAGIEFPWKPFTYPIGSAVRRNHRNQLRLRGIKFLGHSR